MRRVRLDLGMRQRQLASRMKISVAYLSDLETGRRNWSTDLREKCERAFRSVLP